MNLYQRLTPGPLSVRSESTSPASIGSVLSSIGITKPKLRKLNAIAQAHNPQHRRRAIIAQPFVLCGVPVRTPNQFVSTLKL